MIRILLSLIVFVSGTTLADASTLSISPDRIDVIAKGPEGENRVMVHFELSSVPSTPIREAFLEGRVTGLAGSSVVGVELLEVLDPGSGNRRDVVVTDMPLDSWEIHARDLARDPDGWVRLRLGEAVRTHMGSGEDLEVVLQSSDVSAQAMKRALEASRLTIWPEFVDQ